jgi:hypothetical protein
MLFYLFKPYCKCGTLAEFAGKRNGCLVGFDNSFDNGKAKP